MRHIQLFFPLVVCVAVLACGGKSSSKNGNPGSSSSGLSSGIVQGRSSSAVQGATATVLQVQADGSTKAVSSSAMLDASGHYAVSVSFQGQAISDLIVQIQSAGQTTAQAIVSATLTNGGTVTAAPADSETTIEAEVYLNARVSGTWDANATTAGLRALIDAQTASAISASANQSADLHAEAQAVIAALDARAKMLLDASVGGSQSALNSFLAAETAAQVQEDLALDAAASQQQANAAAQARADATITAATMSGLTSAQYTQAARAEVATYAHASANLSAQAQATVQTVAASMEAEAATRSDLDAFAALKANALVQTEVSSSVQQLQSSIATSAGSTQALEASWSTYATSLRIDLKTTVGAIKTSGAAAIDDIDGALATARTTLTASLNSAGGSASAIVQAYATFNTTVKAALDAQGAMGALGMVTGDQTSAILSVLLTIESHGGGNGATGGSRSTISGRFAMLGGRGTSVTAYQAKADGTLTAVSSPAVVDSSGQYTIAVTTDMVTDPIIEASSGGSVIAKALVSGTLTTGNTATARPIDSQSTVEADLYLSALTNGWWSAADTTSALRGYVSTDVAAALTASSTYQADIDVAAQMIVAGINAREALLSEASIGISAANLTQFLAAETQAQQVEDVALNAAMTQSDVQAAIAARADAGLTSAMTADMTPLQYALAMLSATRAALAARPGLSTQVSAALQANFEVVEAHALAKVNEAALATLGAGTAVQTDLENARTALEASLAASGGSAMATASAWAQYDATLQTNLKATVEALQVGGSAAIDTVIASTASAQSNLQSQLSTAGSNAQGVSQALTEFQASVQSSVSGNATLSTLSTTQLSVVTTAIVNLEAGG